MADDLIGLPPDGTGKKVDCQSLLNGGGQTVYRQTVTFGDPALLGNVANVKAGSTPAGAGDNALVVALSPNSPLPGFAAPPTFNIGTMPGVAVTGTFWQATQPVSLASLPALASGANVIGGVTQSGGPWTVSWSGQSVAVSNFPTTQAVSIASLPAFAATPTFNIGTLNGAAQDGTDATGITAPTGGVGIRGWLSGIYGKVSSLLTNLGTPFQAGGSIGNTSFGVNNTPVGSAAFAMSQASIGTAATLIVAARTGAAGTGRIAVTLYNAGSATVYFGASGVTTSTGMPLPAGASATISTQAAIYGIAASGTQTIGVMETF
jgi:hypothetical protein